MNWKKDIRIPRGFYIALVLAILIIGVLLSRREGQPSPHSSASIDYNHLEFKGVTTAQYPLGHKQAFHYSLSDYQQQEFTQREEWDQALDWMFLGILSNIGMTQAEFDVVTKDLPVVRYGMFSKLLTYDYGPTRSGVIGNGTVVALIPHSDSLVRRDHLAHIADEERKNIGQIPDSFWVFEYEVLDTACNVQFWRMPTINGKVLFSEVYGYHEARVLDFISLASFLKEVDDITYANKEHNTTILGGRKVLASDYWSPTVEEIATIYQAERGVKESRDSLTEAINDYVNSNIRLLGIESQEQREAQVVNLKEQFIEDHNLVIPAGTGFSLDPVIDHAGLANELETLAPLFAPDSQIASEAAKIRKNDSIPLPKQVFSFCKVLRKLGDTYATWLADSVFSTILAQTYTAEDAEYDMATVLGLSEWRDKQISEVLAGLENPMDMRAQFDVAMAALRMSSPSEIPLLQLMISLKRNETTISSYKQRLLANKLKGHTFQAARYEGNLAGTSVGMHLFSTDLKAKLYTCDHLFSAPKTRGFKHFLNTYPPLHSRPEAEEYNGLRTWFGLREDRRSIQASGKEIFFSRCATRIFSAAKNQLEPGKEVEGAQGLEMPDQWWNAHYEEIAKEDKEYQLLNSILKWGDMFSWLLTQGDDAGFRFLGTAEVDRDLWFWDWVETQDNLRFSEWNTVGALPRGYNGREHECMERLKSRTFEQFGVSCWMEGGVSLTTFDAMAKAQRIARSAKPYLRRASLNYTELGARRVGIVGGKAIDFIDNANKAALRYSWTKPLKFRNGYVEVAKTNWIRTTSSSDFLTEIDLASERGSRIGALHIERGHGEIVAGFVGAELEETMNLGKSLAMSSDPMKVFQRFHEAGKVEQFLWTGKIDEYLVRFANDDKWTLFVLQEDPTLDLARGFAFRVSNLTTDSKIVSVRRLSQQDAELLAKEGNHIIPEVTTSPIRIRNAIESEEAWKPIIAALHDADDAEKLGANGTFLLDDILSRYGNQFPSLAKSPIIQLRKILYEGNMAMRKKAVALTDLMSGTAAGLGEAVDEVLNYLHKTKVFAAGNSHPQTVVATLHENLGRRISVDFLDFAAYDLVHNKGLLVVDDVAPLLAMDWESPLSNNFAALMRSPKRPILYEIDPQPLVKYELRLRPKRLSNELGTYEFPFLDRIRVEVNSKTKAGFPSGNKPIVNPNTKPPRIPPIYFLTYRSENQDQDCQD